MSEAVADELVVGKTGHKLGGQGPCRLGRTSYEYICTLLYIQSLSAHYCFKPATVANRVTEEILLVFSKIFKNS